MKWTIEHRQEFARKLCAIDRVMVGLYRVMLGLIIVAVMAVVGVVIALRPWGDGNQGAWFYFSVAVLFVLCWVVGQFVMLHRRQRRRRSLATFQASTSSTENGARTWEFRFGPAPPKADQNPTASPGNISFRFSQDFKIPLAALPAEVLPDNEALVCLAAELKRGVPLDEACRLIEPAFANWNKREQEAYRLYVSGALNEQPSTTAQD